MKFKTFKFKLVPNKQQKIFINKTLGCCRFLYNQMLNEKQSKYTSKDKTKCKTEKQYKEEFPFLKEIDSIALQQSRIDLTISYKNFFRNIKKKQKTSLKFKSKRNPKNSYRTVNISNSIRAENNYIKLPKLGFVKFKKSREITGKIKSVTISKNILNRHYISVLCETVIQELPELDTQIGIDLGIKHFLVSSNNTKIENPKYLNKSELKLKRIQRSFSRKKKGSNRKEKNRKQLFRIHEKIANQRLDFLHKLSTKLINENQVICLEDLKVKNMIKNHKLAKSISDCSWSKFVELLKYKADWYRRELIQIDSFFPSSACGRTIDRDYNASLNILEEGLKTLSGRDDRDSSVNNKTLVLCS